MTPRPTRRRSARSLARSVTVPAVGLTVAALALSGCGSSSNSAAGPGSTNTAAASAAAAPVVAPAAALRAPADTARPAVPGKKIAIIALSLDESGDVPAKAAQEAAAAIGWSAQVYNADHSVPAITTLVRQALSTGADGIITLNIDCDFAAQAFAEAKAKQVAIVPVQGYDCSSPLSPVPGPSLFSASIRPATGGAEAYASQAGVLAAQAIIADSRNTAKVISVENTELGILNGTTKGFSETLAASGGSTIVARVPFTTTDYVAGRVTQMVRAALLKHPEATYVKSPFSAATIGAVYPAMTSSRTSARLVGGEGLASELDLIRAGDLLATTSTPPQGQGWAAVDTLNSVFAGTPPADSGLSWVLVDKGNVDSANGSVDYAAVYKKAWGRA